jgi:hypothetical protein
MFLLKVVDLNEICILWYTIFWYCTAFVKKRISSISYPCKVLYQYEINIILKNTRYHLRCDAMQPGIILRTFSRNIMVPSSGSKIKVYSCSTTLKLDAAHCSKILISSYRTTWYYIPQNCILHSLGRKKLKYHIINFVEISDYVSQCQIS